jgi:hypothetical protein
MTKKEKNQTGDFPSREQGQKPLEEGWDSGQFNEEQWKKQRERHKKRVEYIIRKHWRGKKPGVSYTPWLFIRYATGDFGLRPIPSGVAHWRSPDIWVESSDPTGNAVAGEQNFLHVRIFNLGMARATPVAINYYWANPALGLGAVNMNLIGTEWVEVKSQFSREVRCSTPWVPVVVNNGHECLKVNCTNPIADPITAPFQPTVDRHVGQRNITVLQGQAGATLSFRLELNNILPLTSRTVVFARAQHIAVTKAILEKLKPRDLVNRLAAFGSLLSDPHDMQKRLRKGTAEYRNARIAADLAKSTHIDGREVDTEFKVVNSAPRISGAISKTRTLLHSTAAGPSLANILLSREKLAYDQSSPGPQFHKFQKITMESLESRHLDLELGIPHRAKGNDHIAFHFEQWTEDIPLGGYSVIVRVTEQTASKGVDANEVKRI